MSNLTPSHSLNWKITGRAGEGVMLAAQLLALMVKRHGWKSFTYFEYPSLIKGGHQTGQVYAHPDQATSHKKQVDVLVVLDRAGLNLHLDEITPQTLIVYNTNAGPLDKNALSTILDQVIEKPLLTVSQESSGGVIGLNMVCLGLSAYLMGLNQQIAEQAITDSLKDKGPDIIEMDLKAFRAGFQLLPEQKPLPTIQPQADKELLLTANEAIGLGALSSGLQFYSAYPMTPASGLLHFLAEQQDNYPLVVKHAEDEIAAINHALGAAYAGVRAMTGSSGGGLALMTESVSFAAIAEIPIVILAAQRVAPATGLPTWTAQADLPFILSMGHGDIQRIVLTPGTIEEHYQAGKQAIVLAEKYQIPVFVVSDKYALESYHSFTQPTTQEPLHRESMVDQTMLPEDNSYRRYALTPSGISPRSIPGQAHGLGITNSYEHDPFGFATEEAETTKAQADKRQQKMAQVLSELPLPVLYGQASAKMTFVCWGSTILVLKELMKQLQELGRQDEANVIHLPSVWPFPATAFQELAQQAQHLVMVEGNQSGQAQRLIRQETGVVFHDYLRRYDGRPFYTEDLLIWIDHKKQTL